MHRFRVRSKSDASKRSVPSVVPPDMPTNPPSPAPVSASASSPLLDLPPASDFRTSLILPDLSRRFTLLRGQNGEPLSIEDVRSRLALQRANGHENHVTEEEEEIMIDALIRAHNIDPTASASDSDQGYVTANGNESTFGGRYDSSELPSPVSSSSKRHSNNMFGSGRVRDQSYIRSATKSNASVTAAPKRSSRKITLSTPSAPARDAQRRRNDPPALELPTDDDEGDQTDASNSHAVSSPGQGSVTFDTYLSNSAFSPAQIRRASLALQDAIQEFEEGEEDEEDEKILAPRSGPLNGANQSEALHDHEPHAHHNEGPIGYGEAIAWPNDQSGSHDSASSVPYNRTVTASPTQRMDTVNRLPGYVPGMHRPITPRDSATDTDTTGRSLTPQPTSSTASIPSHEYISSGLSSPARTERALPQSILANKRGSITNSPLRTRPRQLSMGDLYGDAGSSSDSTQTPLKSALSDRRRPISPLADSAYASSGRSATPSNNLMDAWSPTASSFTGSNPSSRIMGASVTSKESHMRQASSASSGMETSDSYYSNQSANRANGVTRSVMSPALPDSPTLNGSSGLANIVSSWNGATTNVIVDEPIHRTPTPSRVVSTMEIGQSMMPPHPFRSPTPSRSPVRVVSGGTPSRNTTPLPRSTTPNLHKRTHSRNGSLAIESASAGRSPRVAHFHSPSGSFSGLRQNPLMMSPMLNSSRSSLASTGSSYHSWDEDQLGGRPTHKRGVSVFIDNDTTAWKKHQSGFDFNLGTENAPDPEDIREVLAGLTKQDIAAVQERLVVAAAKKRVASITRPLSGQKKRRASASQSVTSLPSPSELEAPPPFLASSPVLAAQTPPSPSPDPSPPVFVPAPATKNTADHAMKANALLHAMMDSIESSPPPTALPPPPPQVLAAEYSFSSEEPQSTPQTATPPSTIEHSQEVSEAEPPTPDTPIPEQDPRHKALTDALFGSDSDATVKDSHPPFERSQSLRAFAMPPVVGTPPKEEGLSLAEEVERRAMAATAALKSPSTPRFTDAGTNGRKSSRKLNTRQISSPQLVSSTTSVDTIALGASNQASQPNLPHSASGPLPTVERAPQSSKLSQRIKKFTGNLRAKTPNLTGDEVSPYVIEASTPPATESSSPRQMPSFDPPTPTKPPLVTTPVGATDDSNSSAPGTPTSAPPRLRGFMARLRKGRKDSTDGRDKGIRAPSPLGPNAKPGTSPQQAPIPPPPHIPAAALRAETIPPPDNFSSSSLGGSGTDSPQNVPPPPPPPPSLPLSAPANIGAHPSSPPPQPHVQSQQGDEDAVRQLYDAALHLGLDRAVINDILVRSQSTSSRSTAWTQAQTPTTATISDLPTTPPPPALPASGLERSMSVTTPKAPRSGVMLGRQLSLKPFSPQSMLVPSAAVAPQSPSGGDGSSKASIVRRTIIFPSPSARSSPEVSRRPSTSKHRRSRSGSIHSNKSVQDRAPTPPPSRAPTNKRFSKDQSPPVPQLPSGLDGSVSAALQAPRTASGLGSGSNYDSLYDMYTENSGQPDSEAMQGDPAPTGSAVEVLELSDGQIIWSVVDGLRAAGQDDDEDDTSPFPYRMSRNSEYSMQETHELRFKEHHRTASKGSTLSAASKASKGPQSNRPETRVFFSNAGDIGQLIDNLSKSVEAGQFNILPGVPTVPNSYLRPQSGAHSAHSFNSSFNSSLPDGDWTVEERIDHMIAANRKRTGL